MCCFYLFYETYMLFLTVKFYGYKYIVMLVTEYVLLLLSKRICFIIINIVYYDWME